MTKCIYKKFGQSGTIEVFPKVLKEIDLTSDPRRTLPAAHQRRQREDLRLPLVLAPPPRSRHQSLCRLPTRCCLQHLVPRRPHSEETKAQVQETLTQDRHDST